MSVAGMSGHNIGGDFQLRAEHGWEENKIKILLSWALIFEVINALLEILHVCV